MVVMRLTLGDPGWHSRSGLGLMVRSGTPSRLVSTEVGETEMPRGNLVGILMGLFL